MSAVELGREIAEHARAFERAAAVVKTADLARSLAAGGGAFPEPQGRGLVQALLNVRWFDLAVQVARAIHDSGVDSPGFTRRYAQALIEGGRLAEAQRVLDRAFAAGAGSERSELLGLKGRAHKQWFFDRLRADGTTDVDELRRAVEAYRAGYKEFPEDGWHGVNLVACLAYAERHGLDVGPAEDPRALARALLDDLDAKQPKTVWDSATRAEALLALDEVEEAARALRRFVEHPDVTAFNLGSPLRQYEQVWDLAGRDDGAGDLLVLLRARLSEMESGSVRLAPGETRGLQDGRALRRLEAVFGAARFTSLSWFRLALERCGCVAKIGTDTVPGVGTGWLVRGGDLVEPLGDEVLLVTNAHVISGTDPRAVAPEDAVVRFQASDCIDPAEALRIQSKLVFSSPEGALDVTVARFASPLPRAAGLRLAKQVPLPQDGVRVLIIGHPEGGDLAFSINDNALVDSDERYLHYRAPTEGGSSGSPVFNLDWKVVALHHAGGEAMPRLKGKEGTYQANEGIRIDAITAAMRSTL